MLGFIIVTLVLGIILDVAGLYLSIICTKRANTFKLGKFFFRMMQLGELLEKGAFYLGIFAIFNFVFKQQG